MATGLYVGFMTKTPLGLLDPALSRPLLLAKVAKHPSVHWDLFQYDTYSVSVEDTLIPLMDADLVSVTYSDGNWAEVVLTDAGKALAATAAPEMLTGPLETGAERSKAALWFWLLVHGGQPGQYDSDAYGRDGEVVHLLTCGLDLAASSAVRDDSWTVFAGTFVDGDLPITGVTGRATCRCGAVKGYSVGHEVESVTALVQAVLGS